MVVTFHEVSIQAYDQSHGVSKAQCYTKTQIAPCASLFPVPLWVCHSAASLLEVLAYFHLADYQRLTEEDDYCMDPQGSDEVEVEGDAPLLLESHQLVVRRPCCKHLNPARYPDVDSEVRVCRALIL